MRAFRVLMVIYFSFLYNVNSLGISRRYWRISSSSFEVKQYLPPPSASPREVGRYCITSQDSEDILQYLLEMPRLLSHCKGKKNKSQCSRCLNIQRYLTSFMTINWFCLTKSGDIGQYPQILDHELVLFNKIWGYWSISPKNLGILINIPKKSGDIDQYPQIKKTI